LEKWVKLGKRSRTWKNGSHFEKWVKRKKESHFENWVKLNEGHTWKKGSHLEEWAELEKSFKPGKLGHTWKNGSQWVTLGKSNA